MKGVVRPQAMPTRRNPSVQRIIDGEDTSGPGFSVDDMVASQQVETVGEQPMPGDTRLAILMDEQ